MSTTIHPFLHGILYLLKLCLGKAKYDRWADRVQGIYEWFKNEVKKSTLLKRIYNSLKMEETNPLNQEDEDIVLKTFTQNACFT